MTDSSFMDGHHGEYKINKGHFYCWDPYPDHKTLKE